MSMVCLGVSNILAFFQSVTGVGAPVIRITAPFSHRCGWWSQDLKRGEVILFVVNQYVDMGVSHTCRDMLGEKQICNFQSYVEVTWRLKKLLPRVNCVKIHQDFGFHWLVQCSESGRTLNCWTNYRQEKAFKFAIKGWHWRSDWRMEWKVIHLSGGIGYEWCQRGVCLTGVLLGESSFVVVAYEKVICNVGDSWSWNWNVAD